MMASTSKCFILLLVILQLAVFFLEEAECKRWFAKRRQNTKHKRKDRSDSSENHSLPDMLSTTSRRKKTVDNNCVCGIQNMDGEKAESHEFPWLAAIVDYGTSDLTCGGSLINNGWILTAAHCFSSNNTMPDQIQVLLHAQRLFNQDATDNDEEGRSIIRLDVSEIIIHPLFTPEYDFDIALLRLRKPLDLSTSKGATPICLPAKGDGMRNWEGTRPKVVGWRKPADSTARRTDDGLEELNVRVIGSAECSKMMGFGLSERMMCSENRKDSYRINGGSPLILKQSNGQFLLIGVASFKGQGVQENSPDVYSSVTNMVDWIQYHVRKSNPTWCKDTLDDKNEPN